MKPKPRCGQPVRRYRSALGATCGRPEGHPGQHASSGALQGKQHRRSEGIRTHGYAGYGNGCRCEMCTAAKAAYMRQRRSSAYLADSAPEADPAVTHGTRFAYEERGCRCEQCVTAERVSSRYPERRRVACAGPT